mgnify:CR=1 FL=1
MSFFEWVGLTFIMMGLLIGWIYAFNDVDKKKKIIEDDYYKNELYNDFDEE